MEQRTAPGGREAPVFRLRGVTKRFGGVVAVEGVDFELLGGEVHALVGENGAGKSTLMKIVGGLHAPDEGSLEVGGEPAAFSSPRDSEAAGIAMIPQELDLFPELTVAENLYVGRRRPRTRWGGIDWGRMRREAEEKLASLGVELDVSTPVKQLSTASQQLVAIARALLREARAVVMDEPTAALTGREAERLFGIISGLKRRGVGVVYISHRLEEIFRIADRITVLRDGHLIKTAPASALDPDELVRLMVGRPLSELFSRHPHEPGEVVLEVRGLGREGEFEGIDLTLRRGEVVGLSGLIGAGRTELAQTIFGIRTPDRGEVRVFGEVLPPGSPREAMERGVFYVPEERKSQGLIAPFTVKDNITLSVLGRFTRFGFVARGPERELAGRLAGALSVRGGGISDPVSRLSGGNQQKVVLAKSLAREPAILLLDEPTRGIDVGAKSEIYRLIDRLAGEGKAILLISSELEEILSMSDRVIVMREGRISGEFGREEATQENIMAAATGIRGTSAAVAEEEAGR
ncbi:ribose import ATP-binding protein RbsA [Rubrobacter xylanophilus]|uniref:Ribose import ATP-binding protein RbsA n=1 Tax=Rubrobacter xylanophilus TaxID=49319 RepID=A0A510HIR9_9ACTN|nr:sugar ABC transporter ATP-binding protein [Rubrobacter xylanophilus]BBL79165.1 ribose import ATP-binding protein RbsA [Rubrobacter xylanophilus]